MARFDLIMVREETAAKMLQLPLQKFRDLVRVNYLPRGRAIAPGVVRWDVEALRALARGDLQELRDDGVMGA